MSVPADTIQIQLRYTGWASGRLVEAAAKLTEEELNRDFKHADKSVLGTLVHAFAADRLWLGRVLGTPPGRFIDPETDMRLQALLEDWPAVNQRWQEWAGGLSNDSTQEALEYKDMKGNSHLTPLWQVVMHVVNHGTHHRGQVSTMLRVMGYAPPALDMIHFYRGL